MALCICATWELSRLAKSPLVLLEALEPEVVPREFKED
jgi:hypothetical protein